MGALRPWHRRDPDPDLSPVTSPPTSLKDTDPRMDPPGRVRGGCACPCLHFLWRSPLSLGCLPPGTLLSTLGGDKAGTAQGVTWLLWGGPCPLGLENQGQRERAGDSRGLCPPPAWSPGQSPRGGQGIAGQGRRGTLRQRSQAPVQGTQAQRSRKCCVGWGPAGSWGQHKEGPGSGTRQARPLCDSGGQRAPRATAVPFSLAAMRS